MRGTSRILLVAMVLSPIAGGCGDGDDRAAAEGEPIKIGISAARTGALAVFDLQTAQLFEMRIKQINKAGGVLDRPIEVEWIDTKSEKPLAATNAEELIDKGAVVIIATCDFDFSFPAINAARSREVLGIALCAQSPKVATPAIVGPYGGSMGFGSDPEGVAMAEWLRENKPELASVYIFKDTALEYSRATTDYFKARWQELGGKVCGEDTFVGGANLDLSSQVTRLRGRVGGCDVIYAGSFHPPGSQLIRAVRDAGIALPIAANGATNGAFVTDVAGKVSDFYTLGFVCLPTYCEPSTQSEQVQTIGDQFEKMYGEPLGGHFTVAGYALADAVVAAIKQAGSTDGPAVAEALFGGEVKVDFFGNQVAWSEECHRPGPAAYSVEQYTDGVNRQIDTIAVESIPDIGDGSPCSGPQPSGG